MIIFIHRMKRRFLWGWCSERWERLNFRWTFKMESASEWQPLFQVGEYVRKYSTESLSDIKEGLHYITQNWINTFIYVVLNINGINSILFVIFCLFCLCVCVLLATFLYFVFVFLVFVFDDTSTQVTDIEKSITVFLHFRWGN